VPTKATPPPEKAKYKLIRKGFHVIPVMEVLNLETGVVEDEMFGQTTMLKDKPGELDLYQQRWPQTFKGIEAKFLTEVADRARLAAVTARPPRAARRKSAVIKKIPPVKKAAPRKRS
jgi:hypothetical protein